MRKHQIHVIHTHGGGTLAGKRTKSRRYWQPEAWDAGHQSLKRAIFLAVVETRHLIHPADPV
jgi:hypothetical protein